MKPDDEMVAGFVYDQLENLEDTVDELPSRTPPPLRQPDRKPGPGGARRPPDPRPHSGRSWAKILFWAIALLALVYVLWLLNSK